MPEVREVMRCLHNRKASVAKTKWVSEHVARDEKRGKSVYVNSDNQVKEGFLDFYTFAEFLAKTSDLCNKIVTLTALQSAGPGQYWWKLGDQYWWKIGGYNCNTGLIRLGPRDEKLCRY